MGHGERTRKRPIVNELEELLGPLCPDFTLSWSSRELNERLEAARAEQCWESIFPPRDQSQQDTANTKPAVVAPVDSKSSKSSTDMTKSTTKPTKDVGASVEPLEQTQSDHVEQSEPKTAKKSKKSKKSQSEEQIDVPMEHNADVVPPESESVPEPELIKSKKKKRSRSERAETEQSDSTMQDESVPTSTETVEPEKQSKKKRRRELESAESDAADLQPHMQVDNTVHDVPQSSESKPKKRSRKSKTDPSEQASDPAHDQSSEESTHIQPINVATDANLSQLSSIPILEPLTPIKSEPEYLCDAESSKHSETNVQSSSQPSQQHVEQSSDAAIESATHSQSTIQDPVISHSQPPAPLKQSAVFTNGMEEIDVGVDEEDQEPGLPSLVPDSSSNQSMPVINNTLPPSSSQRLKKEPQPVRVIKPSAKSSSPFSRHQLVSILNSLRNENGKLNHYSSNLLPESILVSHIKASMVERFQSLLQEQPWNITHLKSLALLLRLVLTKPDMPNSSSHPHIDESQLQPPYLDADMKELIGAVVDVLVMTQSHAWDAITARSIAESIIQSRNVINLNDSHVKWAQSLLDHQTRPRPPVNATIPPAQPHIISSSPRPVPTAASVPSSVSVKSEPGAPLHQQIDIPPVVSSGSPAKPASTQAKVSDSKTDSAASSSSDDDSSDSSDDDDDDLNDKSIKPAADDVDPFDEVANLSLVDAVARIKPKFIVLDSVNIGRWSGSSGSLFDSTPSQTQPQAKKQQPPFHSWQLAAAVAEVEEKLGVPALCYIPETFVRSPANVGVTDLNPLEELFKAKKLFWLPSGADDDSELIKLATKHKTWIVTNDNFRDHVYHQVIDRKFTTQRCIKFYTTVLPGDETGSVELIDPIKLKANANKQGVKLQDSTHYIPLIQQQQQAMHPPQPHYMKYSPQMPYHYAMPMQMPMMQQPMSLPPGFAPPGFVQYQQPMQHQYMMMPPPPPPQQQQHAQQQQQQQTEDE